MTIMSGCLILNIKMFYPIFDFFGQFVFGMFEDSEEKGADI